MAAKRSTATLKEVQQCYIFLRRSNSNQTSVGRLEDGYAEDMTSQSDGVRMFLQERMIKYCQVKICQTDSDAIGLSTVMKTLKKLLV